MSTEHLDALELRLSNERIRLGQAKTEQEISLRKSWISQIQKEIQTEKVFLSERSCDSDSEDLDDTELLALLGA